MDNVTQSFTKEQLLDYVKKQKIKMKLLEKEITTLKKDLEEQKVQSNNVSHGSSYGHGFNPVLFWSMIDKEPELLQKTARAAINSLLLSSQVLSPWRLRCIQPNGSVLRSSFMLWKLNIIDQRAKASDSSVEAMKAALQASEQKIAKLKALLAKTHQANQRNASETNAYKKAQQEVQMELHSLKQKESLERGSLMEALRIQSIESAFQYDAELAIQQAADAMIAQQQMIQNDTTAYSKKIKELEDEIQSLQVLLQSKRVEVQECSQEILTRDSKIDKQSKQISSLESDVVELRKDISRMKMNLRDEEDLRAEVELELKTTLANQKQLLAVIERDVEGKSNAKIEALRAELSVLQSRLDTADRNARVMALEKDTLAAEFARVNHFAADLAAAQAQVRTHETTIAELKRTLATVIANKGVLGDSMSKSSGTSSGVFTATTQSQSKKSVGVQCSGDVVSNLNPDDAETLMSILHQCSRTVDVLWSHINSILDQVARANGRHDEARERYFEQDKDLFRLLGLYFDSSLANTSRLLESTLELASGSDLHSNTSVDPAHLTKAKIATIDHMIADEQLKLDETQRLKGIEPMHWEAASVHIAAGKEMTIPVPIPRHEQLLSVTSSVKGKRTIFLLEWTLLGESAHSVELQLDAASKEASQKFVLVSRPGYDGDTPSLTGSHKIVVAADDVSSGLWMLRLINGSMWSQVTVSYKISLTEQRPAESLQSKCATLQNELDVRHRLAHLREKKKRLEDIAYNLELITLTWRDVARSSFRQESLPVSQKFEQVNPFETGDMSNSNSSRQLLCEELPSFIHQRLRCARSIVTNASSNSQSETDNHAGSTPIPFSVMTSANSVPPSAIKSLSSEKDVVFSCDSMMIRAGADFRLLIPLSSISLPAKLRWEYCVPTLMAQPKHVIGFSILLKFADGTFPQLVPYRKEPVNGRSGEVLLEKEIASDIVVLFDNTFSWMQPKDLRYRVVVTPVDGCNVIAESPSPDLSISHLPPERVATPAATPSSGVSDALGTADGNQSDALLAYLSEQLKGIEKEIICRSTEPPPPTSSNLSISLESESHANRIIQSTQDVNSFLRDHGEFLTQLSSL